MNQSEKKVLAALLEHSDGLTLSQLSRSERWPVI